MIKITLLLVSLLGTPAFAWYKGSQYIHGEAIISTSGAIFATSAAYTVERLRKSIGDSSSGGTFLIRFSKPWVGNKLKAAAHSLARSVKARYVEPNLIYFLEEMPDDPGFSKQYGMDNRGQTGGKKGADIAALSAWKISTGSKDVRVAVVDTGIDYSHPDLAGNIWVNEGESGVDTEGNDRASNGIDDDENGYIDDHQGWNFYNKTNDPMDGHGHGSHCAGVIGAVGNNGKGIAGINWDVTLVPIKIFSDSGRTTTSAIVAGLHYANVMGVHLTSNSWGGSRLSNAIKEVIQEAEDAGILFVAAAGNSRTNTDSRPHYPSGYEMENIISVAATDHKDGLARFSNYGLESVDIAAPGVDIFSTIDNSMYGRKSGTSMATPHIAGAAALIWSVYPDASAEEVKARILEGAETIEKLENKVLSGGRLNLLKAISDREEI